MFGESLFDPAECLIVELARRIDPDDFAAKSVAQWPYLYLLDFSHPALSPGYCACRLNDRTALAHQEACLPFYELSPLLSVAQELFGAVSLRILGR
jgi:hypothetical protein